MSRKAELDGFRSEFMAQAPPEIRACDLGVRISGGNQQT
jgi:hypothetical protein